MLKIGSRVRVIGINRSDYYHGVIKAGSVEGRILKLEHLHSGGLQTCSIKADLKASSTYPGRVFNFYKVKLKELS